MSDSLFPVLLLLRYMHILGAIALMGGTIFMRFALVPTVPELDEKSRAALHEGVRSRWGKFVMIAAALLLISGIANLGLAARYEFAAPVGKLYNIIAGVKLILALPIFLFASFLTGRSETARKFQANRVMWLNVNLALAVLMVLIGGFLRFVGRDLKSEKKPEPVGQVAVDVKELGDTIAGLNLKQANELSDYIKQTYGLEPANGGGQIVPERKQ